MPVDRRRWVTSSLAVVLLGAAAAVIVWKVVRPPVEPPGRRLKVARLTFAPPPLADTIDPDPLVDDPARVGRLVAQLSGTDRAAADVAAVAIEDLSYYYLPMLEKTAPTVDRLRRLMPRIRARDRLARRLSHANDGLAAFYEQQALADYAANRHTDPRWDAAAQTFLHLANQRYTLHRPAAVAANRAEAQRQLKAALDAGCDDATVLICGALLTDDAGGTPEAVADLLHRADAQNGCGPLFRLILDGRLLRPAAAFNQADRNKHWHETMTRLEDMTRQFCTLADVPHAPTVVLVDAADNLLQRIEQTPAWYYANKPPFDKLNAVAPDDAGALSVRGQYYVNYAWEARGGGFADSVSGQGWKDFADRLKVAHAALDRAWALDPDDPTVPRTMQVVLRGEGADHDAFDVWFDRSMAIDPDNIAACWDKLAYLEPKWGGTPADMIRFGRQCLAAGNWRTDIPTVLPDAHSRVARYFADPTVYWLSPNVWPDIEAAYRGYLVRGVNVEGNRNMLAHYAVLCHQWRVADEQFKALGEAADPSQFGDGSPQALAAARLKAAKLAGNEDAQGR